MRLFIAQFPGDKFANGILFGAAEVLSMLFSNMLLIYLDDIVAFRIVFCGNVLSYGIMLFLVKKKGLDPLIDIAVMLCLMGSIGSWANINSLIMELRVPASNIAAV